MELIKRVWVKLRELMGKKLVRQLFYIGVVVLSLAFMGYALAGNWSSLKNQSWHINPFYALAAIALYPLGMLPTAAAWHWLLRAFNVRKPFALNLRLFALSSLPKHIPGVVWYVTSRTLMYEEHGVNAGIALGATAVESGLLALSGFITALSILALKADLPGNLTVLRYLAPLSVILLGMIIVLAPGASRWLEKLIKRWKPETPALTFDRLSLIASLAWMFAAWSGGGVLLWIMTRALTPVNLVLLPVMIGVWGAAGAVSLTIGVGIQGLGLREVTLGALLSMFIPPILAIVLVIAFRLALTLGEFLWVGIISVVIRDTKTG